MFVERFRRNLHIPNYFASMLPRCNQNQTANKNPGCTLEVIATLYGTLLSTSGSRPGSDHVIGQAPKTPSSEKTALFFSQTSNSQARCRPSRQRAPYPMVPHTNVPRSSHSLKTVHVPKVSNANDITRHKWFHNRKYRRFRKIV